VFVLPWGTQLNVTLIRTTAERVAGMAPESLVELLLEQMLYRTGRRAAPAEQTSWKRSLPILAADLVDAGLGDVEMLVEYHLPLTSQRADVVLAGTHPKTGEASYVVVELKQWSAAYAFEGDPEILHVPGVPGGPRLHLVIQVRGYCEYNSRFTGQPCIALFTPATTAMPRRPAFSLPLANPGLAIRIATAAQRLGQLTI